MSAEGRTAVDSLMKGIAAMIATLFGALILTSLLAFELERKARLGTEEAQETPVASPGVSLSTTAGRRL
jgi:hypothetical protein